MGGRGVFSRATGKKRGLQFGGGGSGEESLKLFPARMNLNKNTGDIDRMIKAFADKHDKERLEYAVTIEANGYATGYYEGSTGSVMPESSKLPGAHLAHNHPRGGWGNFSGTDLESFANSKVVGMTAASRNVKVSKNASAKTKANYEQRRAGIYTIRKTQHFNREAFLEAIHRIQVRENHYDADLSKWLQAHQKDYGYKYSFKKAKNRA